MAELPLISIIVPNYNHARFLEERLSSVLNQTYTNFEVILLDDCSSDNSDEILKNYADQVKVVVYLKNTVNSGSTFSQWKKGLAHCKGEYVWIAESDDVAEHDFLEQFVQVIHQNPNITLLYCQSSIISEKGKTISKNNLSWTDDLDHQLWRSNFVISGDEFIAKYLVKKNVIPNASAVLIKRSDLNIPDQVENYRLAGDWLIWLNILSGKRIGYLKEELNHFRISDGNTRNHDSEEKILRRYREGVSILNFVRSKGLICRNVFLSEFKLTIYKWKRNQSSLNAPFVILHLGVFDSVLSILITMIYNFKFRFKL